MNLTCFVKPEGGQYASLCVELDIASCGVTEVEAVESLKDAIETYLEYMQDEGLAGSIYRPVPMDELKDFHLNESNINKCIRFVNVSTLKQ